MISGQGWSPCSKLEKDEEIWYYLYIDSRGGIQECSMENRTRKVSQV